MPQPANKDVPHWYKSALGLQWLAPDEFEIHGHRFVIPKSVSSLVGVKIEEGPDRFYLGKTPPIIERYLTFLAAHKPKHILELGVYRGGGIPFIQLLAKPKRLLSLELSPNRLEPIDRFIADQGLQDSVRMEFGVDQGDTETVRRIVTEHFGEDRLLQVVFDDASHLLGPTRRSFETIFPRLRPGGVYIVEDYATTHLATTQWLDLAASGSFRANYLFEHCVKDMLEADRQPLQVLAVEAMLASIAAPRLVQKVVADRHWLMIYRGQDDVEDVDAFDLRAIANDHFNLAQSQPSEQITAFLDGVSTLAPRGSPSQPRASAGEPRQSGEDQGETDFPKAI